MLVKGCKALINMSLYASVPNWIKEIPDHFKTQEMCNNAISISPDSWFLVPDHFKTQEICIKDREKKSLSSGKCS